MVRRDAGALDLQRALRIVRRRTLLILLVACGTAAVALLASVRQTPVYQASADVLVQPRGTESVFSESQLRSPINAIETEIEVLGSDSVQHGVRSRLGHAPDISAKRVRETEVMRLTARSTSARSAADVANAYAASYVEFRKNEAVGDLETASQGIRDKIAQLQAEIEALERRINQAAASERAVIEATVRPRLTNLLAEQGLLAQKLDELQVDVALKSGGARIVRAARVPNSPAEPKPVRNGVAGLGLGLILGGGVAFFRENFDESVRTREQLAEATGLRVLGRIPAVRGLSPLAVGEANSPIGEAFRTLRTSLQLLGVDRPVSTVQITSPVAGEGKTTIVAGLGVLLAMAGQRVVLVDGDLRRPQLHDVFGLPNDVGLTSVFLGDVGPAHALQPVPGQTSLYVVGSGPIPSNPAELLSSKRMAEVLLALQEEFDMIIVDSTPVLPVTDATLLAAWVEVTVLVARTGVTTERQLVEAIEQLRRVDANLAGAVLNHAARDDGYGFYYYSEDGGGRNGGKARSRSRAWRSGAASG